MAKPVVVTHGSETLSFCDTVGKSVAALLQRNGFDVSQLVFICEPRRIESFYY